jgi:hypothetical protein
MMELTEFITQAPAIGAILLIVKWNHKAVKSRDCALKDITDRFAVLQSEATDAIKENARIVGQNSELLRENITLLQTLNGRGH